LGNERREIRHILSLSLPLAFLLICCLGLTVASAEDPGFTIHPRNQSSTSVINGTGLPAPNIRIDTDLVLIPVLVTDQKDRLITGLGREHFKIFDDKVEQAITQFASDDTPVSLGLVVDCSGSMGSKLAKSRAAVSDLLATANSEDEFFLVTFNNEVRLLTGFTDRIEEIQNQMIFTRSHGQTALVDAIYLAVNQMKRAKHARKAILVISDGGDNSSRYSYGELKKLVREADVQVYSIGILEPLNLRARTPEELAGPALLAEIAGQTGGRLYEVDNISDLPRIASKIGAALRSEYVLGFAPADAQRDGKYHRIRVKIERPKGFPPLRASFRLGYYAR
jgi:Ca-activated chloride channel family protein